MMRRTENNVDPRTLTDAQLLAAYNALTEDADHPRSEAITAEIQRRNLDL